MKRKYQHVDALRGIAVLMVIFVHIGQFMPNDNLLKHPSFYGQYGVQLFFVMSAFTLCHSIKKEGVLDAATYGSFMTRRFFRIAPMYYLAIVLYFFVAWFYSSRWPESFAEYTWPNIARNLLFVHGLWPDGNNTIVPGGWTIGCEFLFYAGFPALFFLCRKDKRFLAATSVASLLGCLALAVLFRVYGREVYLGNNRFLYYSIVTQMPCFLIGMTYFFYGDSSLGRRLLLALAPCGLLGLIFLRHQTAGWLLTPAMAGFISVGLALVLEKAPIPLLLRKIGEWSYSMYILHFVVFHGWGWLYQERLPERFHNSYTGIILFLVVTATVAPMAALTHYLIEQPFIDYGHALASRIRAKAVPEKAASA